MIRHLLTGAITGTIVMFIWGAGEWFNPLLHAPYDLPVDPAAFNNDLLRHTPANGVYVWPNGPATKDAAGQPQDLMYFLVRAQAADYRPAKFMLVELLTQLVTWTLLTYLILWTKLPLLRERVQLVILTGVAGVLGYLVVMANWWLFPLDYVITRALNLLIGWSLAGIAVAFVTRRYFQSVNQ